jgi:hypothetical protein
MAALSMVERGSVLTSCRRTVLRSIQRIGSAMLPEVPTLPLRSFLTSSGVRTTNDEPPVERVATP